MNNSVIETQKFYYAMSLVERAIALDLVKAGNHFIITASGKSISYENAAAMLAVSPEIAERFPSDEKPVGRVDYLSTNGVPGEHCVYSDSNALIRDVISDSFYGVPVSVVLYDYGEGGKLEDNPIFKEIVENENFCIHGSFYFGKEDLVCSC